MSRCVRDGICNSLGGTAPVPVGEHESSATLALRRLLLVQLLQRVHPRGDDVTELAVREEVEVGPALFAWPVAHECEARRGHVGHPDGLVQLRDKFVDSCGRGELHFLYIGTREPISAASYVRQNSCNHTHTHDHAHTYLHTHTHTHTHMHMHMHMHTHTHTHTHTRTHTRTRNDLVLRTGRLSLWLYSTRTPMLLSHLGGPICEVDWQLEAGLNGRRDVRTARH